MTRILGIPFANITQTEALEILQGFLNEEKNHIIVTPNPEAVMMARKNPAFAAALKNADLSLADGVGITIASRIIKKPLPERVRGVDTIFALFKKLNAENRAFTAYFLGGTSGVAETAKKNMEARFPCLTVLGFHHGFFKDDTAILAEINATSPDILLVCTGMPRAEIWATKNKHAHTRLTLCLGGTLDIMASKAKLAPAFMRKIGLEWFYRLLRQPSRFFRMLALPKFLFFVLTQARKH